MGELSNTDREIAIMRVEGNSLKAIGDKYNVSPVAIHNRLHKDNVRALVERVQAEFYNETLLKSKNRISDLINTDADKETKERDLQIKTATRILESAGVLSPNAQSPYIQAIVNVNANLLHNDHALGSIRNYTNDKPSNEED